MCRLDVAGCLWVASDHECREAMAGVGARVMFGVPLAGLGSGVDARSALNIIYIMRNAISAPVGFIGSGSALACQPAHPQGRARSMIKMIPRTARPWPASAGCDAKAPTTMVRQFRDGVALLQPPR